MATASIGPTAFTSTETFVVAVGEGETDGVGEGDSLGVGVGDSIGVGVGVGDSVGVGEAVGVGDSVGVGVGDGVAEGAWRPRTFIFTENFPSCLPRMVIFSA